MGKRLQDFLVASSGVNTLDFERLRQLSDLEFRAMQVEENAIFIREHKSRLESKPTCLYCKTEIAEPTQLIRLHGGNYHISCFQEDYDKLKQPLSKDEIEYFERILRVLS